MKTSRIEDVAQTWLYGCNSHNTLSTVSKYEQLIRNYIIPYFGKMDCALLTKADFDEFYHFLCKEPQRLCSGNIQTVIMILNGIMDYAYSQNYTNNLISIRPHCSRCKPIVQVFSETEQKEIEKYTYSYQSYSSLAILLALYTGMRIGEICALKWSDVNFARGYLQVTKTVQRLKNTVCEAEAKTHLVVSAPKSSSSSRIIPLPDFVVPYLCQYYSEEKKDFYLISDNSEKPQDPRTLQYAYKKALGELKIPYLNFHCLRHTFATRCVMSGWDVKTLSEVLGHTDIRLTMEYYFHSSFEYKKAQMNKLLPLS